MGIWACAAFTLVDLGFDLGPIIFWTIACILEVVGFSCTPRAFWDKVASQQSNQQDAAEIDREIRIAFNPVSKQAEAIRSKEFQRAIRTTRAEIAHQGAKDAMEQELVGSMVDRMIAIETPQGQHRKSNSNLKQRRLKHLFRTEEANPVYRTHPKMRIHSGKFTEANSTALKADQEPHEEDASMRSTEDRIFNV